jgi:hypothetical protein
MLWRQQRIEVHNAQFDLVPCRLAQSRRAAIL